MPQEMGGRPGRGTRRAAFGPHPIGVRHGPALISAARPVGGARPIMGCFDIDLVFGLDLTAVYAVRYEHGRLSGSPLPRASTRRRVGPRSTHAPRFAIRSHDSVW